MIGDWLDPTRMDQASRRILQQEGLIFNVTELVAEAMQETGITKAELAERLGKSRSYVTQLLDGTANMTLKTVADVFTALNLELCVSCGPPPWREKPKRGSSSNAKPAGVRIAAARSKAGSVARRRSKQAGNARSRSVAGRQ